MFKAVMITGASRGLGLELAKAFETGFSSITNLILNCRTRSKSCVWGQVIKGDLGNEKTLLKLYEAAHEYDLDVLVNNAGVYLNKPISEYTTEEIRMAIRVNLLAPMILTRLVWPIFARKKFGVVVNINSLASQAPGMGETVYAATKAGLAGFSEALQYEATRDGVRVINVSLGAMRTDMTAGRKDHGLLIDPAEVAETIVGLCKQGGSSRITDVTIKRRRYS